MGSFYTCGNPPSSHKISCMLTTYSIVCLVLRTEDMQINNDTVQRTRTYQASIYHLKLNGNFMYQLL
jgi:hypothetical protein